MKDKEVWVYSFDETYWGGCVFFDSKEEAIADGFSDLRVDDSDFLYVAKANLFKPDVYDHAADILTMLGNDAYDECGEYGEDYLDDVQEADIDELGNMLQDAFDKWQKKHPEYKPNCFTVSDVERIEAKTGWKVK